MLILIQQNTTAIIYSVFDNVVVHVLFTALLFILQFLIYCVDKWKKCEGLVARMRTGIREVDNPVE